MPSWGSHSLPGASQQGSVHSALGLAGHPASSGSADQAKAGDMCGGSLVLLGSVREDSGCQGAPGGGCGMWGKDRERPRGGWQGQDHREEALRPEQRGGEVGSCVTGWDVTPP